MLDSVALRWMLCSLLVLCSSSLTADAECPAECSCPPAPPRCPLGVSWVTDHCGCCKVCSRQYNQDCSASEPCDHIRGLRCHLGVGGDPERGLCRAQAAGLPCELDGLLYQHGEVFQPSCQHQCSCTDGVVGCMALCPHPLPLPSWRCRQPRVARVGGACCEEWLCDEDNHISEEPETPPLPSHISALLRGAAPGGATPGDFLDSDLSFKSNCFLQTSAWSECSSTCGMGVSSRVTNDNPGCQLTLESRLCRVRTCHQQLEPPAKKGKRCQRTLRQQAPVRLTFDGCSTARRYRPRSCGSCTDGRCCSPSASRTVRLTFHCPDGGSFFRHFMWIQRCSCSRRCRGAGRSSSSSLGFHSDIHTF
ncbi:cellular communication network factor 1, like 2 [Synchiropus splendidus]|uniref:cellular communication network factor 1, like 2 n=1 Tax=Synchiropus splendidus TaxID=270530 RepID=UPI00237DCA67|nr:cellular communication network factor 1, like 2 [Synchiropus splendidus]